MKTLGIIGGLGPESTLDYYQRIIALYRERTGDRHYPEFVIVSVDLRKGLDFMPRLRNVFRRICVFIRCPSFVELQRQVIVTQ